MADEYRVAFVVAGDEAEWRELFSGYAEFYGTRLEASVAEAVWGWLLDAGHPLEGLLARDAGGEAIGIVHFRACPRSLSGGDIGFVDDMFIAPAARGSGAADAMVSYLQAVASARGWPLLRWITQDFNARGRALYDRYTGGPSDFIMYQLPIE